MHHDDGAPPLRARVVGLGSHRRVWPVIRVTWEWLGQGPALDLADTVTIGRGRARGLLCTFGDRAGRYGRRACEAMSGAVLRDVLPQHPPGSTMVFTAMRDPRAGCPSLPPTLP